MAASFSVRDQDHLVNPLALTIAIAYAVVVVIALVGILWIWHSTHCFDEPRTDTADTQKLAHREKGWFIFAVVALGVLLLATLAFIPYGEQRGRARASSR